MSTVMMAREHEPLPTNGNQLAGEKRRAGLLPRQVICVCALIGGDLIAVAISLELAILMRKYFVPHLGGHLESSTFPYVHYLSFGWLLLVPLIFFGVEGLYTRRRSQWNEIGHLIKAIGMSLIAMLAALALTQKSLFVSRATILLTGMSLFVLLPIVRYWTKRILGALGPWKKRILILGATDMAVLAMRGLAADTFLGYEVAGVVDDNPQQMGPLFASCKGTQANIIGNLSAARELMQATNSRDVLIAMPSLQHEKLLALVHELQPCCDNIYVVPELWGLPMMNLQVDGFLRERVMMLKLSNNLAKPWNNWLKRGIDLLLGTALGLFLLPLCIILAFLVKLESVGPALFIQERLGYRGRNFLCVKFRTMRVDGDELLARYLTANPQARDEWQKYAKLREHDPRLTRIGGFLRRWSLDELPQLYNVLKGEMSLVGPRPYLPHELERIGIDLSTILSARPGMTGFWQVSGRNQITLEDRVKLEAWYVRNWTTWLDCIVFAKTFRVVLYPENGASSHSFEAFEFAASANSPFDLVSPAHTPKQIESKHHAAGA